MGIVIKQSIRSSIIAYIGVLIGYVNVLWLFPYFLEADQIGLFRLIQSSAFLMATFGQFGLGSALVKFFPKLKDQKGFLSFIILGGLIGFIVFAAFTFLFNAEITAYFAKESGLFIQYFGITLLISFLLIQFQLLESYCRSLLKIVIPTLIRDIQLRLSVTVLVALYALDIITFGGLIQWLSGAYLLMVITVVFYLRHLKVFHLNFNFKFIDRPLLKQILTYAVYMMIGAGGTQIVLQIDSIMVSGALGLDATGIYMIAFFIGGVIEMPKRSITQISAPLIAQAFEKNDMPAVEKLYKQTSINQMIIGSLLLIGIWANLESLYSFIPNGEVYIQGINVVLFIGLGKLSDMIFGTNGEIIVMSKHYKFNVIAVGILAILTVALNLLLIPSYGIEGAAIASFLAMLTFNLSKFLFVWMKFKIQPFSLGSIKLLAIIGLVLWVNQWIPKLDQTLLDIIIRSLAITILLVGLTIGLKVSKEVNSLVLGFIDRLKKN
ncbi:polysaccharide biosynthesis C-terminal domain-containing protein [Roseivirga sp.]|uniref:oligosaccharide flippase family protein n=1 Tax=Roseivirga sp. TaxID=1964215 RepID=UPI002B271445|nr:polysaccharide biosynthesis C-terminal domain-containing protein [Roseivirga sp.]